VSPLEDLPAVLTVDEVAALLRTGRTATYEAVRRGDLPSLRVGRKVRIPRDRLLELLNGSDHRVGGRPAGDAA
jgi:excisionase family DNA binding protein